MDGLLGKRSNAMKYEKYCLVVAECNSLVNPIIYSLRDDEMRRTFKWILCCLCRRGVDRQQVSSPVEISSPLTEVTLEVLSPWYRRVTSNRGVLQKKKFHILISAARLSTCTSCLRCPIEACCTPQISETTRCCTSLC